MTRVNQGFFSSSRADYETPQPLFNSLDRVFQFNLDVCADARNAKVKGNFISRDMDGLKQQWALWAPPGADRLMAWMNPEYGPAVPHWTAKAAEEAATFRVSTVGLLAARTDNDWFHEHVSKAQFVLFLRGRVRFLLPCVMCGHSTDRRRRPSIDILDQLSAAGALADLPDIWEVGTLPVCDQCARLSVSQWGKQSSNSPAMGSIVVGWGFIGHHLADILDNKDLRAMGVLMTPYG